MPEIPETRKSLILRLRRQDDVEAWEEFVAIYEPMMVRMGRRRGMQDADIQEIIQHVLISVASAIVRWSPDAEGRFRSWLTRIFRNQMIDQFRRDARHAAAVVPDFSAVPGRCADEGVAAEIQQEYRRQLFRKVAAEVRPHVQESTWQAFWQTAVEGACPADVAQQLELSVGSVYAARSRVMARIKTLVQRRMVADEVQQ